MTFLYRMSKMLQQYSCNDVTWDKSAKTSLVKVWYGHQNQNIQITCLKVISLTKNFAVIWGLKFVLTQYRYCNRLSRYVK